VVSHRERFGPLGENIDDRNHIFVATSEFGVRSSDANRDHLPRGSHCRTASEVSAWVRALDDTVRSVDSASVLSQLDVSSLASRPSGGLVPQSFVDRDDLPSFRCARS